jgi:(E)-4-hydroxy-3-methylbut-2-enyl-diphosphate synthase
VKIGDARIGDSSPILVQSMTSTPASDLEATVNQALRLVERGCEIVRVAVPDMEAALSIDKIKARLPVPLVADIHYDHRLALAALERGADKVRVNPGNLGGEDRFRAVLEEVRKRKAAIRIGVNSGSLERRLLEKHGHPCAEALVESATGFLYIAEEEGVRNVVVSIKSTDVLQTVTACRMLAETSDAAQHLGITEAGLPGYGTIKSAVGLGALLLEGIGDTIRVSLTGDPLVEIDAAFDILKASGARILTPEVISCPTCGRTKTDMTRVAEEISARLEGRKLPIRVAVMGCAVNGPGEAREADIGIAAGEGFGMIFKKGEKLRKVKENEMVSELLAEIDKMEMEP